MKTLELADATESLAEYVQRVDDEPVILTIDGRPVAALVPIEAADLETALLGTSPQFLALIERSRARQEAEGGISSTDLRHRLGLPARPARAPKAG